MGFGGDFGVFWLVRFFWLFFFFLTAKVSVETNSLLLSHWSILGCFSSSFLPGTLSHFIASLPQLPSRVVFCPLNCKYWSLSLRQYFFLPTLLGYVSLLYMPCLAVKSCFAWSCLELHRLFFPPLFPPKREYCCKVLVCFLITSHFEDSFSQVMELESLGALALIRALRISRMPTVWAEFVVLSRAGGHY